MIHDMPTPVFTDKAPQPVGPYSQAIRAGSFVFVSGQIALDPDTSQLKTDSFEEEVRQVMANVQAVLEASGASFKTVVKVNVFLSDMGLFGEFNTLYQSYVQPPFPARSTVEVSHLPKDVRIEIDAIAMIV